MGFKPSASIFSLLIKSIPPAPSLILLAFTAVTVPFLSKAGFTVLTLSHLIFLYSSSSEIHFDSPPLCGISTGIISFENKLFLYAS